MTGRELAAARLGRLQDVQRAFYAGDADEAPLRTLLTGDIVWHVPGENAIAGTYAGIDAVMGYFARRRDLAARTFTLHSGELLVGEGDHVAMLTDGSATIGGREHRWSTVGLYRFDGERLAECWLLPLDPAAFDAVWRVA